jgi:outer membrane protein
MPPMKKIVSGAFAAALLSTVAVPAFAADLPSMKAAPVLPVIDTFDPFLIRVRGLAVLPDASGTKLNGNRLSGAELSDNGIPEVDFTYFFTKNIAAELIAGISHHRLTAGGSNVAIANTTLLPPTLTLQYHFALGQLDPYLGVGVNYTWFLETTSANNVVNIHSAFAPAFQFGFDYYLTKNWLINVDAKYLMLTTDANVGARNNLHLNVNPWIVGAGIGYRFGGSTLGPVVAKY